ncbi:hypothetical protein GF359_06900, partial [candidate division WOR-3 bacterium]|nr:hypothetical protein [candidate division WOR-3 bacterium]MBD3364926.1 hypothetical protein [candidate division WOR-3 bacterium]
MKILMALILFASADQVRETGGVLQIKPVIDYEAGLVYYEEWIDSVYLGIHDVQPLNEYLAANERVFSAEDFLRRMRADRGSVDLDDPEGIIPDINIQMGKEVTNIDVAGSDRIELGSQVTLHPKDENDTTNPLSGIKLEQDLSVSVSGTIARKTEVIINHSSGEDDLFGDNKVRISYTGDEDEIVKKVEAGDVSLNLPSKQSIPAQKGLFGINTQLKLGPVDLYAVASREETQAGSEEFQGSSQTRETEFLDKDFIKRKLFYVFHDSLRGSISAEYLVDSLFSKRFHLYKGTRNTPDEGNYWYGWSSPYGDTVTAHENGVGDQIEQGFVYEKLMLDEDYNLWWLEGEWVIELTDRIAGENEILAVACTLSSATGGQDLIFGDNIPGGDEADSLILLQIWGDNTKPTDICWTNMRRNHYTIPMAISDSTHIDLDVLYKKDGTQWVTRNDDGDMYSKLLGIVDSITYRHELTTEEKLMQQLIFKNPRPFADSVLGDTVPEIYEEQDIGSDASIGGKYKIQFKYKAAVGSYDLGPFVKEGSVKVFLNDEELSVDEYTFTPFSGMVTINQEITPNDEVRISYEKKVLFSLDRKSLLGMRAETELIEGVELGSSLLYRKVGFSGEGKPSLDLEPYSRTVGELDLSVDRELGLLTTFLDWLPLISTEKESNFTLTGNSALSMPNPNTHGSGSVWVEDFESTSERKTVNLQPSDWYQTSLPLRDSSSEMDTSQYSRIRPSWKTSEYFWKGAKIYGNPDLDPQNTNNPPDNSFVLIWDEADGSRWSGIIGSQSPYTVDITEVENLEIIMNSGDADGVIHFDFGSKMDEDQLRLDADGEIAGYDQFDTEDGKGLNPEKNDRKDAGEDIGLDGVSGEDGEGVEGDDGNDDYDGEENYNGTETNGKLDTEDLNNNNSLDSQNEYLEFSFDLTDPDFVEEYVDSLGSEEEGPTGWVRLSVPLSDTSLFTVFGNPDSTEIEMFRVWFEGMDGGIDSLSIYSWSFVGNKWENPEVFALDSTEVDTMTELVFIDEIGTQNVDYIPPFSLGKTVNSQTEQDNALQMKFENIQPEHATRVSRWDYSDDDFRGYDRFRIYVHNDTLYDPVFFLRMGSDSLNYYEVRAEISQGQSPPNPEDPLWKEFVFEMDTLISLKRSYYENRDTSDTATYPFISSSDSTLFVKGRPSFSSIEYYVLGIINEEGVPITGEVWFNDFRLEGPIRNIGTQLKLNGKLNFADVADVSVGYTQGDGEFVGLGDSPGPLTGGSSESTNINTSVNLDKFGLEKLGFRIPFRYSFTKSNDVPRYDGEMPDILLDSLGQEQRTGVNQRQNYTASFSHSQSGKKNKLVEYTLDALGGSANIGTSGSLSNAGLRRDSSYSENYSLSYGISPDLSFKVFDQEISYFPYSVNLSANLIKGYSRNQDRPSIDTVFYDPIRNFNTSTGWSGRVSYKPIKYFPLSASYTEGHAGSVSYSDATENDDRQISVDSIVNDSFSARTLGLTGGITNINLKNFGNPSVNLSSTFNENKSASLNQTYITDTAWDGETIKRNLSNSGHVTFNWRGFDLEGLLGGGKEKKETKLKEYRRQLEAADTADTTVIDDAGESDVSMQLEIEIDSLDADTIADTIPVDTTDTTVVLTPRERTFEASIKRWEFLERIAGVLQPISFETGFSRNSGYNGYEAGWGDFEWRNNWDYISGIADIMVDTIRDTVYYDTTINGIDTTYDITYDTTIYKPWASRSWGANRNYKLSSGINLWDLSITGYVQRDYAKTLQQSGELHYTKKTTLPMLKLSYQKLGDLFGDLATNSSLSTSVSRVITERGVWGLVPVENDEDTDTIYGNVPKETLNELKFSPLISWNTTWKGDFSTNLSAN